VHSNEPCPPCCRRGETAISHKRRLQRLQTQLTSQARVIVVDWYEDCEPQEAAIGRAGKLNPNDIILVCASWSTCTRPAGHRHDDGEVIVHPRRG
jgi:hypothetical protein